MRSMKPGAMPIIELQSVQMSTKFGKKPRPFFKITGWRSRVSDEPPQEQISDQRYEDIVEEVNAFDDSMPF
jgi:hypothetical protein